MVTIKVSTVTRDRLKAQAAAAHVSLGTYLERLADNADREARFVALHRAIAETPPEHTESWRTETEAWEAVQWKDAGGA